jgi:hypothetical protein
MPIAREPILHPVEIVSLRSTQITVGMREVQLKRKRWRKHKDDKKSEFLGRHMIPVILGPKERHYIVDHHHLARALHDEGESNVLVTAVMDLRALDLESFWSVLDHNAWVHPYDAAGRRRDFAQIPKTVADLEDDPFRSLAGELRRAGGFAKDTRPFSEFLWADFLRARMKHSSLENDLADVLGQAMALAKSREADYLPGWCGPVSEE